MSDFITFLAESDALPADRAQALDRELGRIAPLFGAAVMDPANWGMARSLVTGMVADGVNLDDQADVQRWIADYNTGLAGRPDWEPQGDYWEPEGDDWEPVLGLKDAFGLPDELPPVRLPPDAELAEAARQAGIIAPLAALTAWLGEAGREVGAKPGICCPVTWPTQQRRLGSVSTSSLIFGTWRWSWTSPI